MVNGDTVELFDAGNGWQSIYQSGSKKNRVRNARPAVSTFESETAFAAGNAFNFGIPKLY